MGSEMCIRDRSTVAWALKVPLVTFVVVAIAATAATTLRDR